MNRNNIIIGDFNSHICVDIEMMTRMACSSRSGSPRATFTPPTTPSCRTLSTAGSGSKATNLTSPACPRTYATYVNGECTTTYFAHNTGLMGSQSTPRSPLRGSLSAVATTWETFTTTLDNGITSIASPSWKAYKSFSDLVRVRVPANASHVAARPNTYQA